MGIKHKTEDIINAGPTPSNPTTINLSLQLSPNTRPEDVQAIIQIIKSMSD